MKPASGGKDLASGEVAFVGDIMLARKVSAAFEKGRAPESFWGDVLPDLQAAEAVVGNLEGALSASTARWGRGFKAFHFVANPEAVSILTAGNVRAVALANNHSMDATASGLRDTIGRLDEAGIVHAGAGANLADAMEPAVFRAAGRTVGLVSLTNTLRPFRAASNRPGTLYTQIDARSSTLALLTALVRALEQRAVDVKVLSVHWGPNLRPWPPARYRAFARAAIDAGFDIVHGHSAHILQALEYHGDGLILYDTGDFLDDYWVFPGIRIDRSFLFRVDIAGGKPFRLRLLPVLLTPCAVNRAQGKEADAIRDAMVRRCRGYAVQFEREGDMLVAAPLAATHDARDGALALGAR